VRRLVFAWPFLVGSIAVAQGLLYLLLIPPWQHYDEPGHFEYVWLIAHHRHLFQPGQVSGELRREVVASMEEHGFFRNIPPPGPNWWFNYTQLDHPPGYYTLVSLPLRLVHHLNPDIVTQLYVARLVSLALFAATVGIAAGMMRDLTPPGHWLRWAVPLTIVLLPPFADLMTAVNNDVGAVAVSSGFLWGTVRTVRFGITWWRGAWVVGTAVVAVATKNTAAYTLALVPLVFVVALWVRFGWRWRWLLAGGAGLGIVGVLAVLGWGDAAFWYRVYGAEQQDIPTRVAHPAAPVGSSVLVLEAGPGPSKAFRRRLSNPLLMEDIRQATGQVVTVGGWLWTSRPATVLVPGVAHSARAGETYHVETRPVAGTTTPRFVAQTFTVPAGQEALEYALPVPVAPPARGEPPLRVFLDGAVLAVGAFPTDVAPVFDDAAGRSGTWGGERFVNLVRNGSAEHPWPRLRPWVQHTLSRVVDSGWGRTPALLVAALCDVRRSVPVLATYTGFLPLDGWMTGLAWGHVRLSHPVSVALFRGVVAVALVGGGIWLARSRSAAQPGLRPALLVLAVACVLVWGTTATRVLPKIGEGVVYPMARYTFPSVIPTALAIVGGWWVAWPRRVRPAALWLLVGGLVVLHIATIRAIGSFYSFLY
jgi:hypothetical protein